MVNQFYYPTWKAVLMDQGTRAMTRPAIPEGLLEVQIPPGNQHIRIDIPTSRVEYLGRWLSVLSFLCSLMIYFWERTKSSLGENTSLESLPN
jgi:hypothetical protein